MRTSGVSHFDLVVTILYIQHAYSTIQTFDIISLIDCNQLFYCTIYEIDYNITLCMTNFFHTLYEQFLVHVYIVD